MLLTLQNSCILCGLKVVLPQRLQEGVLGEIHVGHTGIVRMKFVALMYVWRPTIVPCARKIPKTQLKHLFNTGKNKASCGNEISQDRLKDLILANAHTKWVEAVAMKSMTAG